MQQSRNMGSNSKYYYGLNLTQEIPTNNRCL